MNIDNMYEVFQTVSLIRTAHYDVSISPVIKGWAYSQGGHNVEVTRRMQKFKPYHTLIIHLHDTQNEIVS